MQHMIIARFSRRLSLLLYDIVRKFWTENGRVRERERETQREREREREQEKREIGNERRRKESGRASEFEAKWQGNCRKQGTAGVISLIRFARSVNVHNNIWLVSAKFHGLWRMVPGYRFWGALSLHSVSCTSLTKNSSNTKVVSKNLDRDSCMFKDQEDQETRQQRRTHRASKKPWILNGWERVGSPERRRIRTHQVKD